MVNTLRDAQPTIFFGVPRVYEKMKESIEERSEQIKGLKRRLSNWARKKGLKGNLRRQNRWVGSSFMEWWLAQQAVFVLSQPMQRPFV